MYLIGGPPFSGTTLLALMLNEGTSVCLDEPDLHNPKQSHRGIPHLRSLFPDSVFPPPPEQELSYPEAVGVLAQCEHAIAPCKLGMKTCGSTFVRYAEVYRERSHPVIAVVRDIRDALMGPLPEWVSEASLNTEYRVVWQHLHLCDLWLRYEDLVTNTAVVLAKISAVLSHPFHSRETWDPAHVNPHMLKLDRHVLLRRGRIVADRVGLWKGATKPFSEETLQTAAMMGYR
jgi:hypothetical protein